MLKYVKVGEKVLTMRGNGTPVYSEIIMFMHQNEKVHITDYVNLITDTGKSITLSDYHLIFVSKTDTVFAKDVHVNQSVFVYEPSTRTFHLNKISSVAHVAAKGMYAPLTNEGTIVVDDVYASCYALFPSHRISHAVFSLWRFVYPYLGKGLPQTSEYHWYADALRKSMNYLNIFPYSM